MSRTPPTQTDPSTPRRRPLRHLADRLTHATTRGLTNRLAALSGDRGDVPGWVLVAVMTAGLVTALWLVADDQLTAVLQRAITSVGSP